MRIGERQPNDSVQPIAQTRDGLWLLLSGGEWIYAPLVDNASADLPVVSFIAAVPSPAPTPAVGRREGAVNSPANLRTGPGLDYGIVRELKIGDRVQPVARTRDELWLQLRTGHWIFAALVDGVSADLPIARSTPPAPVPSPTGTPIPAPVWDAPVFAKGQKVFLPDGLTIQIVNVIQADSDKMQLYMERAAGQACRGCLAIEMKIANVDGNAWEYVVQEDFQLLRDHPGSAPAAQVTCDHARGMPSQHANRIQRLGLHYGAETRYLCFEDLQGQPRDIAAAYRLAYRHAFFFPGPREIQEENRKGWIVYFALR